MPPFVYHQFMMNGLKRNQLPEAELVAMLCPQGKGDNPGRLFPLGLNISVDRQDKDRGHSFSLVKSEDGSISLHSTIRKGDVLFTTTLAARRVNATVYEITSLVFDNRVETLDSRQEICNVLEYIGRKQLLATAEGGSAEPHQEKGRFGKFGRFMTRLIPDDGVFAM